MSSATTTAGAIVCPFIAEFDVDSRLNITSSVTSSVTINNIDHTVTATAVDLKAAFDCSGWGVNMHLGEEQQLIGSLVVSLPSTGAALKSILSAAVTQGDLNTYLRAEYDAAFATAFPGVERQDVSGDPSSDGPANTPVPGAKSDGATGTADAGASVLAASVVTQTATLASYEFALDISGGEAANAMYAGLSEARLNTLFMQLPYATILEYVDASGNPLDRELPLKAGDSITFVFDINVTASTDNNTSSAPQEHAGPAEVNAPAANFSGADRSIQMDLGSRRVAFVIPQAA